MLIYKTDTTQDLTVKKKKSVTAVNQTTHSSMRSEATLWSSFENLLVGLTKTLSLRQDLLPLSGIAEAVVETKSKREERTADYSPFPNASGLQSILS